MAETIRQAVVRIKDDPELAPLNALNEQQVKVGIIEPLLEIAGWDRKKIQTEFVPEYKIGNEEVDYALRIDSSNRVFVEAKNAREDLRHHEKQLLDYCKSTDDAPHLGVLTNGRLWWLYAPSTKKDSRWEKPRQFCTIDIQSDKPDEVQKNFSRFLFKDKVGSGAALRAAGRAYGKLLKDAETQKAIFDAWNRIIDRPEEGLIKLITDVTEDICGHNPAPTTVRDFLKKHRDKFDVNDDSNLADQVSADTKFSATGKEVQKFKFLDSSHPVKSWRNVFTTLCELIYEDRLQNGDFDKVLKLRGSKRAYFARHGTGLRKPRQIKSSEIYVELDQFSNGVAFTRSEKMLNLFGYKQGDLMIEARDKTTHALIRVSLPR